MSLRLLEARLIGADAVLLIAAILNDSELARLNRSALELGMETLIEVHDEQEAQRVLALDNAPLIGINNRNLHTFVTDLEQTERLRALVPADRTLVSERNPQAGAYEPSDGHGNRRRARRRASDAAAGRGSGRRAIDERSAAGRGMTGVAGVTEGAGVVMREVTEAAGKKRNGGCHGRLTCVKICGVTGLEMARDIVEPDRTASASCSPRAGGKYRLPMCAAGWPA